MQRLNKDPYDRINNILKKIKYNKDKIVRLERVTEKFKSDEIRFQAQNAILNYHHREIQEDNNEA